MPCEPIISNGKAIGFMCSRKGKSPPKTCYKCGKPAKWLCDFRVVETYEETDEYRRKAKREIAALDTCDKPMCDDCVNRSTTGMDFCDEHASYYHVQVTLRANELHEERLKDLGIQEEQP
jgi:hypothetical protein